VTFYTPPDFSSANGADYIIITHGDFYTASQTLANYRQAQGMRVKVVDVDDLYNQYNFGIYHSIAIKNFIRDAYFNWQSPPPAYVVLVGDGHWNFKHYVYGSPPYVYTPIYMPPHMAWVDLRGQGEVDDSTALAAVVGTDILPDLYIGRLPVNSVAEINAVISKTIAYEQAGPQDWQRHLLFVADNTPDPAGDFTATSDAVIANYVPKNLTPDRIYLDNYSGCAPLSPSCPAVNAAITRTLNQTGALFMNYIGHGSMTAWTSESVFNLNSVAT